MKKIYFAGSIRGGREDLALYAALNAPEELAERITAVYSNDGPGFREHAYEGPAYRRLQSRSESRYKDLEALLHNDSRYTFLGRGGALLSSRKTCSA